MASLYGRFPASAKALVSPAALLFLESLGASRVRRDLWDEISEIERDPQGRGTPYHDEDDEDPEFDDLRMALGVAGYAIFYVGPPTRTGVYVTAIKLWEFAP